MLALQIFLFREMYHQFQLKNTKIVFSNMADKWTSSKISVHFRDIEKMYEKRKIDTKF